MTCLLRLLESFWEKQGLSPIAQKITLRTLSCGFAAMLGGGLLFATAPFSAVWLFWFGVSSILSAWNFFALSRFIYQNISNGWSRKLLFGLVLGAQLRLFLTAFLVYTMFVFGQAPLSAILAGVAISLVFIVISTLCHESENGSDGKG